MNVFYVYAVRLGVLELESLPQRPLKTIYFHAWS